jgi:hypothetical protein
LTLVGTISKRTARKLSSAVTFVSFLSGKKPIKVLFTATLSFVGKLTFTRGIGRFVQYTAGLPKTAWSATTAATAWTAGRVKQLWQNNDVQ